MQGADPQQIVQDYLEAFKDRELSRCLDFYHEDGVLIFGPPAFGLGRFRGNQELELWHEERFARGLRLVEIEEIEVDGDTVTIRCIATSRVLRAIQLDDFRGIATFTVLQGKIKEARLGLQRGYRFHI